jgi:glycopeptide antibiotics resistance protein
MSLTLTAFVLAREKCCVRGSLVLGITVFLGFLLLDTAVLNRMGNSIPYSMSRCDFVAEYNRFFHGSEEHRVQILLNLFAFIPFGFLLSEFLTETKKYSVGRRISFVVLVAFGFSLGIELLQFILRVGFFELTDLAMNTTGAVVGAGLALIVRKVFGIESK